jgi:hypothetical protein
MARQITQGAEDGESRSARMINITLYYLIFGFILIVYGAQV